MESKFRLLRIQLELWFDSLNIDFIDLAALGFTVTNRRELMVTGFVLMRRTILLPPHRGGQQDTFEDVITRG